MKQKYFISVYSICAVLGIAPFYSFKISKLIKRKLNKTWLSFLLVHKALLVIGYFLLSFPKFESEYSLITLRVLEHPSHISYWIMPFSTVLILLLSTDKKWEDFLIKLTYINNVLPPRDNKRRYVKYVLNFALNIILLGYMFLSIYYCSCESVIYTIWHILYSNVEEVFWLYTNIFINEITLNLKERYEVLNKKLLQIVDISVENKFMSKDVVFLTVKELKKIKLLYRNITDLVDRTSFLLGWQIFCLMTYTLLDALSILNALIVGADFQWLGTDVIELFVIIIYNIYAALSCDLTNHEGAKIIKLCYNLEVNFPMKSPIRDELLELAEQAKYFAPKFVSVGLFNINRKMLLSIITTVTTYVIVIIQFNNVL